MNASYVKFYAKFNGLHSFFQRYYFPKFGLKFILLIRHPLDVFINAFVLGTKYNSFLIKPETQFTITQNSSSWLARDTSFYPSHLRKNSSTENNEYFFL